MSSDTHATITYTLISSYEVIVNGYFGMPMDPLDPYAQLVMEAPPSPDYIPGPEYPKYLPPADDVFPAEEHPLPAAISPTADKGNDDADDNGDDLSEDDADDEDEEESSDNEEEEEEHLAPTVPAPALHSSISASEDSDQTEPFEEGKTAATPPPSTYRVTARISVRPHIPMPFPSELEVERLLAISTPPLSPVLPTSYPLPPFLMPLPIFTPLPPPPPIILPCTRASMVLMRSTAPSIFILAPLSRKPPIGTPPLLPIPLPTSLLPLPLLLPSTSCKEVMSSDSHATITYTLMSSYEVIVNWYFGMPVDPLDPYVQLVMEAPPLPDYIPGPEVPPSPDTIPGSEYLEYLPPADDVLPTKEQPLPAAVSPTTESPGYITDLEPEMEPEEEDGDDEKSEGDSIKYPTSRGDGDVDDEEEDGDDEKSEGDSIEYPTSRGDGDADDGDDLSEDDADDEDEEESSDKPFEEGETAATPPPFGYHVAARISVGESSVTATARQIRLALTVADSCRAEDRLIGRLRRERRYFHTLSTTYAQEVAHSCDYCT
nr:hypothetical protein [Tanacetum cinerariifolium]